MHAPTRLLLVCLLASLPTLSAETAARPELPESVPAPALPIPTTRGEHPATGKYLEALPLLQSPSAENQSRARTLLKEACDAELSHAQSFVGFCMIDGTHGYRKAPRKGVNFLMLASKAGNSFATLYLGFCHLTGTGTAKSPEKATECFLECVSDKADYSLPTPPLRREPGESLPSSVEKPLISPNLPVDPADHMRAFAHFALGELLSQKQPTAEAQEHYVQAATLGLGNRAGIRSAAVKAAMNYAFGQGVQRDMAKADEMLKLSKKLLNRSSNPFSLATPEADELGKFLSKLFKIAEEEDGRTWELSMQRTIAGSFADPKSKQYDAREAAKWYELAAEGGDAWAMLSLAFLHINGALGKPDMAKACEWFRQAGTRGKHNLGTGNYVICLEKGLGTPRDHAAALKLAKENALDDIICHLATLGQCPAAPLTYEQELELNRVWAEKKKDPCAQYLWAQRWWHGWGVERNQDKSVAWLKKAAEARHGAALFKLGVICGSNPDLLGIRDGKTATRRAFEYYEGSAAAGYTEALGPLGYIYCNGTGCAVDLEKALQLYQRALVQAPASDWAHNGLGDIFRTWANETRKSGRHEESEKFAQLMYEHYEKAVAMKNAAATYQLGQLAYSGDFRKANKQEAFVHFDTAAELGYDQGVVHHRLAQMLETGDGVTYAPREAAYHYRVAALNNHMPSLIKLCELYSNNWGLTQDWDSAIRWLLILIFSGDLPAQVDLGDVLMQKKDYEDAFSHWNTLLESKNKKLHAPAHERLSLLYAEGKGCQRNAGKAAAHFRKALEMGNREAQYRQACELLAEHKYPQAIPFLRQACAQGLRRAIYKLGELSLKGQGVRQNEAYAFTCFVSVADSGDPEAMARLVEQTLLRNPNAPSLEKALRYVERLNSYEDPRAPGLLARLLALKEETGGQ